MTVLWRQLVLLAFTAAQAAEEISQAAAASSLDREPRSLKCSNSSSWMRGTCLPGGHSYHEYSLGSAAACCAACASAGDTCVAWVYRSGDDGSGDVSPVRCSLL